MKLSELKIGERARISKIHDNSEIPWLKHRLLELGFLEGEIVSIDQTSFFRGTIAVTVRDSKLALRRSDAEIVEVLAL